MQRTDSVIEVVNLKKSYGATTVLRDVTFRVLPGQTTILTGDNGAGKTTLLRVLAGLSRPTAGTAKIVGRDIGINRCSAQASLSFLPQGLAFHPAVTPERLVQFYASIRGRRLSRERVAELLHVVDLLADRGKPVRHLSGGMVQRLGIALLLLPDAPVLLLDEPAISLDPAWRRRLGEILREETKKGKAVFLTTHLPREWHGDSHQYLCCRGGRVVPGSTSFPSVP